MTRLFLHFCNVSTTATFRIWSYSKKNPYLKYVSSHFRTLTIELYLEVPLLRLNYIDRPFHTFAVVIISLYIRNYAILLHFTKIVKSWDSHYH